MQERQVTCPETRDTPKAFAAVQSSIYFAGVDAGPSPHHVVICGCGIEAGKRKPSAGIHCPVCAESRACPVRHDFKIPLAKPTLPRFTYPIRFGIHTTMGAGFSHYLICVPCALGFSVCLEQLNIVGEEWHLRPNRKLGNGGGAEHPVCSGTLSLEIITGTRMVPSIRVFSFLLLFVTSHAAFVHVFSFWTFSFRRFGYFTYYYTCSTNISFFTLPFARPVSL